MNWLAGLPPRFAISVESRAGILAASPGLALASAPRNTRSTSGTDSSRARPPREKTVACAWRAATRTTAAKASDWATPLAVESSSGRTATRSGFSRMTAFVIASATNADTRGSRRLPARRSPNASLSNRPRRT